MTEIGATLARELGPDRVAEDAATLAAHRTDYWILAHLRARQGRLAGGPACVVRPRSTAEVATTVRAAQRHGVAVVAYSPFGHGHFPGPGTKGFRVLQEIAAAHNATPRQVALRFLVRRGSLFAIPKASTPEHAVENAGAADLRLTEAELAQIDAALPRGPRPSELPML